MELLIDLIQQYPHLYDIKDKNYKNNELKEKCWENIAVQVELPGKYTVWAIGIGILETIKELCC